MYMRVHTRRSPSEQEESSIDVQKRLVGEFYDTVEDIPLDE